MSRASLALIALLLSPGLAFAGGTVTKILRPQVHVFDAHGQPAGSLDARKIKVPAAVVATGADGSVGIRIAGKIIFLRGTDVQTEGLSAPAPGEHRAPVSAEAGANE
jgi:hypothetical protein